MAVLYLIRHGQASFGMDNYDLLTEIGRQQCTSLPAHFSGMNPEQGSLFSGSMERHRQSVAQAFPDAKAVELLPGLNEFNHEDILRIYNPSLFNGQGRLRKGNKKEVGDFIRTTFPAAMLQWVQSETGTEYEESFQHFKSRCWEALRQIISRARNERRKQLLAVTSGGVISTLLMQTLQIPDHQFPALNLNIANASVSAFLFNDKKISLSYFNNYSHLPEELVSYR